MNWYNNPDKVTRSPYAPPGYVFSIAWTILYTLYAWAWCLQTKTDVNLNIIFTIGIAINLFWTVVFFGARSKQLGLVVLLSLLLFTIYQGLVMYSTGNRLGALFMVVYIGWLGFATILNATTNILDTTD